MMDHWQQHPDALHILSLGAGVQSTALALMAERGVIGPKPDAAIFADVGDEPDAVYEHLDWLETQLSFPVYRVSHGHLSEDALQMRVNPRGEKYARFMIPLFAMDGSGKVGMVPRQCTQEYKIRPIARKLRELAGVRRGDRTVRAIQWIGISTDEAMRMKPSRDAYTVNRWPLIEMNLSRQQCIDWMTSNGYPKPPRSACVFCPYKSDEEWKLLRDGDPKGWAAAIRFEREAQNIQANQEAMVKKPFLHRSGVPLDQADLSTAADHGQLDMFNEECTGMCGL